MSTVTPRLGLVKPTTLEQYALSVMNNNSDALDLAIPRISSANSTLNTATWDFTASKYTRIDFGNGNGIVVAQIDGLVDTASTLPAKTAAGTTLVGVTPAGYAPSVTLNYGQAIFSGAGLGDEVQMALLGGSGNVLIRSNTTGTYLTTVNSAVRYFIVYQWDGVL